MPGLGEVRRKALLRHFGSLKRLRAATVEEIAEVPGIGPQTAQAIVAALADAPTAGPAVDIGDRRDPRVTPDRPAPGDGPQDRREAPVSAQPAARPSRRS